MVILTVRVKTLTLVIHCSTCSRCLCISYCSKECQLASWGDHKKVCAKKSVDFRTNFSCSGSSGSSSSHVGVSSTLTVKQRYTMHLKLLNASKRGNVEDVKAAIEQGADVDKPEIIGDTPCY